MAKISDSRIYKPVTKIGAKRVS